MLPSVSILYMYGTFQSLLILQEFVWVTSTQMIVLHEVRVVSIDLAVGSTCQVTENTLAENIKVFKQ